MKRNILFTDMGSQPKKSDSAAGCHTLPRSRWRRRSLYFFHFFFYFFSLACLLAAVPAGYATSIVIFRGPHGARIVVAADSQFSLDSSGPFESCKIRQIQPSYWTAISGLVSQPTTGFNGFQFALDASSHPSARLDDIAAEVRQKVLAGLPPALKQQRKTIGSQAFWRAYKDGFDAYEEAFWGQEDGVLRLVYLQFTIHRGRFGGIGISPVIHACPGEACADPRAGFGIFLGHHKVIDKFMTENSEAVKKSSLETLSRQFVQMEIEGEPDCHCAPPIDVLSLRPDRDATWVGEKSAACREPQ